MDASLLLALNDLRAPWLDAVLAPLSSWGMYLFPVLMLLALLGRGDQARADRRRAARSIADGWLVFFLATFVSEQILKPIIARPRPTAHEAIAASVDVLGATPGPGSLAFPSGTATAAFAGATWIALRWGWRPGAPALALALVVGLSRVYAAVHWPSDIVAGAFVGAAFAFVIDRAARRLEA